MPARNRRQRAGALNYLKRKDLASKVKVGEVEGVRVEGSGGEGAGGSGSAEVEGVSTGGSGSVEVEGVGGGGNGSVEVEGEGAGGSGSMEVEEVGTGGSGSVEVEDDEGGDECGLPSTSEEAGPVRKIRRLSAIGAMADEPAQLWLDNLPRDDLQHMALLLYGRLPTIFGLSKTDTAAVVGEILHKNERKIRRWVEDFMSNGGEFSESQQGHYVRNNTLMSNEELCERAREYVRENAAPRGRPNLTSGAFCQWVNNELLPNTVLDPGYPRRVSVETARKWLHELGFSVLQMSKRVFIDGHERLDVVESRERFLRKMTECGFLRPDNAPTELKHYLLMCHT